MQSLALKVGKRVYLFGAKWEGAAADTLVKDAKAAAHADKTALIAVRERPAQYALANLPAGIKAPNVVAPWYSAAAAIADNEDSSLLGAWHFADGGVWILAVSTAGVMPQGDVYLTDLAEARALFDKHYSSGHYRKVYAPADWADDAETTSLQTLLSRRATVKVQKATAAMLRVPGGKNALSYGMIAAAAAFAVWYVLHSRQHQQTVSTEPAPPPTLSYIPADILAEACMTRLDQDPWVAQIPGFTLASIQCNAAAITYSLTGYTSYPVSIRPQLPAGCDQTPDGKILTCSRPLGAMRRISNVQPAMTRQTLALWFGTVAEQTSAELNQVTPPPVLVQPGLPGDPNNPPKPWTTWDWTLSTSAPVWVWSPMTTTSASTIQSMAFDLLNNVWTIKGESYARD